MRYSVRICFKQVSRKSACCRHMNPRLFNHFPCSFHGGMQAVTYQWGSYNHQDAEARSPDEAVLSSISHAMADWAGKFPIKKYPVDR